MKGTHSMSNFPRKLLSSHNVRKAPPRTKKTVKSQELGKEITDAHFQFNYNKKYQPQ